MKKYLWNTKTNARHSVRVICDEEGMTLKQKNEITETINCESGFNPCIINDKNLDKTSDFGISQFNNGKNPKTGKPYWIGKGADFKDSNECLQNPAKCVKIMCREWKLGHQNYWNCYKKLYGNKK